MSADEEQSGSDELNRISAIRVELLAWTHSVMHAVISGKKSPSDCPDKFLLWCDDMKEQSFLDQSRLDIQKSRFEFLGSLAQSFTKNSDDEGVYNKFVLLSEEFINDLVLIERDCLLEVSGVDALTGLRSQSMIKPDIAKELERYARHGEALAVSLMQIDEYERVAAALDKRELDGHIKSIAELLKKSLRSFDDGYRYKDGSFILSLKQVERAGGIVALERFRGVVKEADMNIEIDGEILPLTLSCCVVEPLPEDNVDDLLLGLTKDMEEMNHKMGAVFEYHEISPLERYVKDMKEHG